MISMIFPLAVGNAVRLILQPPSQAVYWRVLRKATDDFIDQDDDQAYQVYEGDEKSFVDARFLQNDVVQFYRAYYWDGSIWTSSASVPGKAHADYGEASHDVQLVVRERLEWGLQEEVRRATLRAQSGAISVLTAPPVFEDTRWPMVTVSLLNDSAAERGLGEEIWPDAFDGDWSDDEGWIASTQLSIVGWSLNPDERIALRRALRRLIIANLPVFSDYGFQQVEFSQHDVDAVSGEYPAPIYQSAGTFSCLAPVIVGGRVPAIDSVIANYREYGL